MVGAGVISARALTLAKAVVLKVKTLIGSPLKTEAHEVNVRPPVFWINLNRHRRRSERRRQLNRGGRSLGYVKHSQLGI